MPYLNPGAVMHQIKKQKKYFEAVLRPLSGKIPNTEKNEKVRMRETKIFIGLNDAETKEQIFETEKYLNILKNVCRSYRLAFSVDIEEGGYFHENGEYTEETSLVLTLIEADPAIVDHIAEDLCTFFHQESVLITEDQIEGRFYFGESLSAG